MVYLLIIAFCFALALSRIVRCVVFHPIKNFYYAVKDFAMSCEPLGQYAESDILYGLLHT